MEFEIKKKSNCDLKKHEKSVGNFQVKHKVKLIWRNTNNPECLNYEKKAMEREKKERWNKSSKSLNSIFASQNI